MRRTSFLKRSKSIQSIRERVSIDVVWEALSEAESAGISPTRARGLGMILCGSTERGESAGISPTRAGRTRVVLTSVVGAGVSPLRAEEAAQKAQVLYRLDERAGVAGLELRGHMGRLEHRNYTK